MPFNQEKFYLGKLCKRGHDYDGTGSSLRVNSHHQCLACKRKYEREWSGEKWKGDKEYYVKYRQSDKCKAYEKKRRGTLKHKKYMAKYTKTYRCKEQHKKYAESDKGKAARGKIAKRQIGNLEDIYIKRLLRKNCFMPIPFEMVVLKRSQLLLHRGIKKLKEALNGTG